MSVSVLPVRGTKDFLPQEMIVRDYVQNVILQTYQAHGFKHIQTPIMESIERLSKSEGGENLSLIFKILKRGEKLQLNQPNLTENDLVDSGLRYDLTMPLSRFFANNRMALPTPFKCIQIGQSFRAERPQKGRLREFYQCDVDIIGDSSVASEIELIDTVTHTLLNLGFSGFTVRINDRRLLTRQIEQAGFAPADIPSVCMTFDKQDKIGEEGVRAELLEKGFKPDVVEAFMGSVMKDMSVLPNADDEVVQRLKQVIDVAQRLAGDKFQVVFDKSLVRGMGYYTGIVFEIHSAQYATALGGGGRYDNMIGQYCGEQVPAVGFSIGFERICDLLLEKGFTPPKSQKYIVLVYAPEDNLTDVFMKAAELRKQGYTVALCAKSKKLGKQLDVYAQEGYTSFISFADGTEKPLGKRD